MAITGLLKNVLCVLFTELSSRVGAKLSSTSRFGCTVKLGTHLSVFMSKSYIYIYIYKVSQVGFPGWLSVKESACQCRKHKIHGFNPCFVQIPWRGKWQLALVFLPGKFHGQRSLVGYSPWGCKELDTTEHTRTHLNMCTVDP